MYRYKSRVAGSLYRRMLEMTEGTWVFNFIYSIVFSKKVPTLFTIEDVNAMWAHFILAIKLNQLSAMAIVT